MTLLNKNFEWTQLYDLLVSLGYTETCFNTLYQSVINIEQLTNQISKSISLDSISLIFVYITILLTIIAILSDHNHENEHTGLYNILLFSTGCLVLCSSTQDLF